MTDQKSIAEIAKELGFPELSEEEQLENLRRNTAGRWLPLPKITDYMADEEIEQMNRESKLESEIESLKAKCARYEEALNVYADEENWDRVKNSHADFDTDDTGKEIFKDHFKPWDFINGYELAKKALGK